MISDVKVMNTKVVQLIKIYNFILVILSFDKIGTFQIWNLKKWQVRTKIWDPKWFKYTFPASTSSCYVNKMLDISCEFLDTASTYTKYHEYHFLNHQIPLFHAPAVEIWSMQNCPKFEQGVLNNVERPHKKWGKKKQKKQNFFPECLPWHSGKRPFPEC